MLEAIEKKLQPLVGDVFPAETQSSLDEMIKAAHDPERSWGVAINSFADEEVLLLPMEKPAFGTGSLALKERVLEIGRRALKAIGVGELGVVPIIRVDLVCCLSDSRDDWFVNEIEMMPDGVLQANLKQRPT